MQHSRDLAPTRYIEPLVIKHDVYLYDDIGGPENYIDLIQAMDSASENEIFNIRVATGGGDLEGCIAIIHAIRRTKAQVIGFADALVASAGTIIFLSCHNWVVNEFASFMFHDGSTGVVGKFNENTKMMNAINRLYRDIAEKIYKPFFTEEEITRILDGSDLYVTSDEMFERIKTAYPEEEGDAPGEEGLEPGLILG